MRHGILLCSLLLVSCAVDPMQRDAEITRFQDGLQERLTNLALSKDRVLSLAECEQIALAGNLQYRVQLLATQLQDDEVLAAFTKLLPRAEGEFRHIRRSNDPLIETDSSGQSTPQGQAGAGAQASERSTEVSFEDRETDSVRIGAVIPVLDFGATRFAWHIAEDERMRERLTVVRARQTLLRDVRVAYVRLASTYRDIELLQSEVDAYQQALAVARSFAREGLLAPADVATIEAGLARAELDLTIAQRDSLLEKARMSRTLSIPGLIDYRVEPLPEALPPMPGSIEDVRRLEDLALQRRPEAYAQDIARHAAATLVRQRIAEFFPRLDGIVEFNWSSNSKLVNPDYFNVGFSVAHSLLNGGETIARYRQAQKGEITEAERALLVQMGIVFEVDFRILELARAIDGLEARAKLVAARKKSLELIVAEVREGLESGAELARSLADLHAALREQSHNRADVFIALHELDAATAAESTLPALDAAEQLPSVGANVPTETTQQHATTKTAP